jgi:hypothetical protein
MTAKAPIMKLYVLRTNAEALLTKYPPWLLSITSYWA